MGTDEHNFFAQAADAYDDILVPGLFDIWAAEVTRRLGEPGDVVVDVACGTGVLAQHLFGAGWMHVIGVDLSDPMLDRAAGRAPEAEWVRADARDLPFDDAMANGLACSFGLMFMPDPVVALAEMARITRPGCPMVVSTWMGLDECAGMDAIVDAVESVGGLRSTELFQVGFAMDDYDEMAELADEAGLRDIRVSQHVITAQFDSVEDLATTYATSLALGDPDSAEVLADELARTLGPWTDGDEVSFPMSGIILEARA